MQNVFVCGLTSFSIFHSPFIPTNSNLPMRLNCYSTSIISRSIQNRKCGMHEESYCFYKSRVLVKIQVKIFLSFIFAIAIVTFMQYNRGEFNYGGIGMKRRAMRALRIALIGLLVLTLFASSALASSVYARINKKTKVYESPSTHSESASVKSGLKVKLEDFSNGWGRVVYKGITAYIPLKYLTLTSTIKMYTASEATVYKKAGSGKLGTVDAGTTVYVVGLEGKYAKCKRSKSSSSTGYIRTNDLTKNKVSYSNGGSSSNSVGSPGTYSSSSGSTTDMPSSLKSTVTSPDISKIEYTIYVAQNLIGAPYKEDSNPPTSFDCATYTHWCYGKAKSGSVKGSSKSQGYDSRYDMITSVSDLKRGDLVCFDTVVDKDLSDHVGIYLGKGYFLHASSVAKMVIVSNLNSGYYNRVFSWGLRIFYD